jgi:hypothetical protein
MSFRVYTALSELRAGNADVLDALLPFFEPILAVMNSGLPNGHQWTPQSHLEA